jgi:hypothetical protein
LPQRSVFQAGPWRVVLVDSITQVRPEDAGSVAVSGSHGGTSAASFAAAVPLALAVFNDAGIGKDAAGIAGLARLEAVGIAAATVSHASARIGEARDSWENGVVSRVNGRAARLGLRPGQRLGRVLPSLPPPPA